MTLARVDFLATDFTDLITQKGYNVKIEFSVRCPCIDPSTGRGVPNCSNCDGRGNYYYQSTNTKGLITRMNKEVQMGDSIGALEPGYAYLTLPHTSFISVFDRVTNLDSTVIYSEVVLHNGTEDSLTYVPVGSVLYAAIQASPTSPIVPLNQGTDYTLDVDGNITYSEALSPTLTSGQGITFRYYCNPIWIVKDTNNYVRDTFVLFGNPTDTFTNMPIRALMKLEFMGES